MLFLLFLFSGKAWVSMLLPAFSAFSFLGKGMGVHAFQLGKGMGVHAFQLAGPVLLRLWCALL